MDGMPSMHHPRRASVSHRPFMLMLLVCFSVPGVARAEVDQEPGDGLESVQAADAATQAALIAQVDSLRAEVERLAARQEGSERENAGLRSGIAMLTTALANEMREVQSLQNANATEGIPDSGRKVVWTLALAFAAYWLARISVLIFERRAEYARRWNRLYARAAPIAPILIWTSTALLAVNGVWGIEASTLITAVAAGIVAVAFTAQDVLKNAFAGLVIAIDPPFSITDKISVAGTYGDVQSIGMLSTRIVTPDDSTVTVPNAQVVASQVSNANSGEPNCQVVTDLYLPGWIDEGRAKKIAFEAAAMSKYAYLEKPIVVLVEDVFKETFLTQLKVKAYVLHRRHEFLFKSDITERARAGFREAGLLHGPGSVRISPDLTDPLTSESGSVQGENGEPLL